MQAQDRLRDASGTCDGVVQADRRGKFHAERERLGVHMLVRDDGASTGWRTWCGYGLGREDAPGPYLGVTQSRLCNKCKKLCVEGLEDEMLDITDTDPFVDRDEAARLGIELED